MKTKFLKVIAIVCVLILTLSFVVACNTDVDDPTPEGTVEIKFTYKANADSKQAWKDLIDAYNNGQGKIDGVYVKGNYITGDATNNLFTQTAKKASNVITITDSQDAFQNFVIKYDTQKAPNGYMVNLQPYAEADEDFKNNDINESTLNWWRMTYNTNAKQGAGEQKHVIGAGQNLMGVPVGTTAWINAYSTTAFEAVGFNIISIPEDELDAYNKANGTSLQPHGYAEYKTAPVSGMKSSKNLTGDTVYKVFNNCISMNWEEQRIMLRYFTKTWNTSSPTEYGFVSEYWFNYGWSVGGDVMGFNGTDYDFTLLDGSANYVVVDDNVTINNSVYNKGDIVLYEDKVNANMDALVSANKVYAISSQYDAVKEYVSLQLTKSTVVDTRNGNTYYGYEVANPDTDRADSYLTNGTIAMTRVGSSDVSKYQKDAYSWINFSPAEQYREYEGGSTYESGGVEQLKVIGETYDGKVYTGELKTVNGVSIVGSKSNPAITTGLVIPACSDPDKYQASWDFISWVATEGQKYFANAVNLAPVSKSVLFGSDYAQNETLAKGKNLYAVATAASNAQRGDWGYFESGSWVTAWADSFNSSCRRGTLTLSAFESAQSVTAKTALNNMYCVIKGIR